MTKNIGIEFGAMVDPIRKQLIQQGVKFDEDRVRIFQKELDAITQLRFNTHIMTESMADKAYEKLMAAIIKHIKMVQP